MKNTLALTIILSATLHGQQNTKRSFQDVPTNESLRALAEKVRGQSPLQRFEPSTGPDASVTNVPGNLIKRSDVISFNGITTLIPKLAIIRIPANFESRINNHTPGNRILTWPEFYKMNRGWITTVEVTRIQAEGNEPIATEVVEVFSKGSNLVIATFNGGPISILAPKEEAPIQTASTEPTQ